MERCRRAPLKPGRRQTGTQVSGKRQLGVCQRRDREAVRLWRRVAEVGLAEKTKISEGKGGHSRRCPVHARWAGQSARRHGLAGGTSCLPRLAQEPTDRSQVH